MQLNKWNYNLRKYDKVNFDNKYNFKVYTTNMNEYVTCPHCLNDYPYGECYTSLEFHTELGFGYAVCKYCYEKEVERKYENM